MFWIAGVDTAQPPWEKESIVSKCNLKPSKPFLIFSFLLKKTKNKTKERKKERYHLLMQLLIGKGGFFLFLRTGPRECCVLGPSLPILEKAAESARHHAAGWSCRELGGARDPLPSHAFNLINQSAQTQCILFPLCFFHNGRKKKKR